MNIRRLIEIEAYRGSGIGAIFPCAGSVRTRALNEERGRVAQWRPEEGHRQEGLTILFAGARYILPLRSTEFSDFAIHETGEQWQKEQKGAVPDATAAPAKPAASNKAQEEFKKKRERRVIPPGVVYVAATFKQHADRSRIRMAAWCAGLQRAPLVSRARARNTVCRAASFARCRGAWRRDQYGMKSVEVRVKVGLGARVRRARAGGGGAAHRADPRRDADSAQRLPSSEKAPGLMNDFMNQEIQQGIQSDRQECLSHQSFGKGE